MNENKTEQHGNINQRGHEVHNAAKQNNGTEIQTIEKIENFNVSSLQVDPGSSDMHFTTKVSGNQNVILQLPNNAQVALEIIDGLVARGLIKAGEPLLIEKEIDAPKNTSSGDKKNLVAPH